jgi:hypothetical protein
MVSEISGRRERHWSHLRPNAGIVSPLGRCQLLLFISDKDLAGFPNAANRESGDPEQQIPAAEQRITAAHRRVSSYVEEGEVYHAIEAIFRHSGANGTKVLSGTCKISPYPLRRNQSPDPRESRGRQGSMPKVIADNQ